MNGSKKDILQKEPALLNIYKEKKHRKGDIKSIEAEELKELIEKIY